MKPALSNSRHQNRMIVTDCAVGTQQMTPDEARDALGPDCNARGPAIGNAVEQLHTVAALCNAAEFDAATRHLPLANRKIHGDATDQAILRFAEALGPVAEPKRCWQTKYELAFNSKNKFMIRAFGLAHRDGLQKAMSTDVAAIFEPHDMYAHLFNGDRGLDTDGC